jgi:transposase
VFVKTDPSARYHRIAETARTDYAYINGAPEIIVPDNLKAGVKHACFYEPDLNPTYQDLAEYYGIAVIPARPRKPKDKSKVEVGVQVVERWILARLRDYTFFSLVSSNQAIRELLDDLNRRSMRHLSRSRRQLFETLDQPALRPLPQLAYEFALVKEARVNIDYHVEFERHYYSVPHTLSRKPVRVRATEKTVEILYQGKRVASHLRSNIPGRYTTLAEHMPPAHQWYQEWSPERFIHWAQDIGPHTALLIQAVLRRRRPANILNKPSVPAWAS